MNDPMQASRLMEQEGVEGWEEKMSRRRADLASAVCKELPVLKKKKCFPTALIDFVSLKDLASP